MGHDHKKGKAESASLDDNRYRKMDRDRVESQVEKPRGSGGRGSGGGIWTTNGAEREAAERVIALSTNEKRISDEYNE